VKDVLAYLRLLVNPQDDVSLEPIVNVPPRKIGAKTLTALKTWAETQQCSLLDVTSRTYEFPTLSKSVRLTLVQFAQLIARLRKDLHARCLSETIDLVLGENGYEVYLKNGGQEEQERWGNLLELRRVGESYDGLEPRQAIEAFLEYIALVGGADVTQTGEQGTPVDSGAIDAVTIMTLHAAKGLEYTIVFIAGLEEERRRLYVGLTRAMRQLTLVRTSVGCSSAA